MFLLHWIFFPFGDRHSGPEMNLNIAFIYLLAFCTLLGKMFRLFVYLLIRYFCFSDFFQFLNSLCIVDINLIRQITCKYVLCCSWHLYSHLSCVWSSCSVNSIYCLRSYRSPIQNTPDPAFWLVYSVFLWFQSLVTSLTPWHF